MILREFLLLDSFYFLRNLSCGSCFEPFLRVGIDEDFDLVLVLNMLMEIFDDFPIVAFIFDEKFVDFQQLPVLRTIALNVVVRRNALLPSVDLLDSLIPYLFPRPLLHELIDQ